MSGSPDSEFFATSFDLWWIIDTSILHLDVMGSHIVALSDSDVAADLIAQRSYSDRVRKSSKFRSLQGFCTYRFIASPRSRC